MFENLQRRLRGVLQTLQGKARITEKNIADAVKEIRKALVEADVNYKVAKEFTEKVKEKALGREVLVGIDPGQYFVKIVFDELKALMGGSTQFIRYAKVPPTIILLAGLQGSGKTTFAAKLALFLKEREKKTPLLVAADVYRPAAIEQLSVLAQQAQVGIYKEEEKDPVGIAQRAVRFAQNNGNDVVIIDTAGRLAIDEAMMQEIQAIKQAVQPHEILFVVDAMTGQDAVNTAKAFNDVLDFSGVVLTKLDGDTRGGAAISIKAVVNKPIKFISIGEKLQDIDYFHPDRMASRILGMGDIISLVEKLEAQIEEEEAMRLEKKLRKNQFDLEDLLKQMRLMRKMGSLQNLIGMLPGFSHLADKIDIDENALKRTEAIILSMTPEERRNPAIINASRKRRIAKGSGTSVEEVNLLLRQYQYMRKALRAMNKHMKKGRKLKYAPFMKQLVGRRKSVR